MGDSRGTWPPWDKEIDEYGYSDEIVHNHRVITGYSGVRKQVIVV